MPPTGIPAAQLRVVRYALLAGPLIFGAVALWVRRQEPSTTPPELLEPIRVVAYGFCFLMLAALLGVRRVRAGRPQGERGTWSLVGWALAEAAALFGAVFIFLGGEAWPYAMGILLIFASWSLVPTDPAES